MPEGSGHTIESSAPRRRIKRVDQFGIEEIKDKLKAEKIDRLACQVEVLYKDKDEAVRKLEAFAYKQPAEFEALGSRKDILYRVKESVQAGFSDNSFEACDFLSLLAYKSQRFFDFVINLGVEVSIEVAADVFFWEKSTMESAAFLNEKISNEFLYSNELFDFIKICPPQLWKGYFVTVLTIAQERISDGTFQDWVKKRIPAYENVSAALEPELKGKVNLTRFLRVDDALFEKIRAEGFSDYQLAILAPYKDEEEKLDLKIKFLKTIFSSPSDIKPEFLSVVNSFSASFLDAILRYVPVQELKELMKNEGYVEYLKKLDKTWSTRNTFREDENFFSLKNRAEVDVKVYNKKEEGDGAEESGLEENNKPAKKQANEQLVAQFREAIQALGLDKILKKIIKEIQITPDFTYGNSYNYGSLTMNFRFPNVKIFINDLGGFLHEMGHALEKYIRSYAKSDGWLQRFKIIYVGSRSEESSYAEAFRVLYSNDNEKYFAESFAEDFAVYMLSPGLIESRKRELFKEIGQDLFSEEDLDDIRACIRAFIYRVSGVDPEMYITPTRPEEVGKQIPFIRDFYKSEFDAQNSALLQDQDKAEELSSI